MKLALTGGTREADQLAEALLKSGVEICPEAGFAVIAAHPFDTDLWECASLSAANKPHIGLVRPAWQPGKDDQWQMAGSAEQAADLLAQSSAKNALLAVGNSRLLPFYRLKETCLCVRSRNAPHPPAPPVGCIRTMRGPFDVAGEVAELKAQKIDMIVAHNAGGQGGWPKLGAARALGLPVILIDRPRLPEMEVVSNIEAALKWVKRRIGLDAVDQNA